MNFSKNRPYSERAKGFGPLTFSLGKKRSTVELRPRDSHGGFRRHGFTLRSRKKAEDRERADCRAWSSRPLMEFAHPSDCCSVCRNRPGFPGAFPTGPSRNDKVDGHARIHPGNLLPAVSATTTILEVDIGVRRFGGGDI